MPTNDWAYENKDKQTNCSQHILQAVEQKSCQHHGEWCTSASAR